MSIIRLTLQNAGTKSYVDINGGNTAPGTPLIIFPLNQPGGTRNQNWRLFCVNSDQNLYKIQNVLGSGYASVDSAAADQVVKLSLVAFTWEVTIVDAESPNYIIKVPNTNLVWGVAAGSPFRTNITIVPATAKNVNQQWNTAVVP